MLLGFYEICKEKIKIEKTLIVLTIQKLWILFAKALKLKIKTYFSYKTSNPQILNEFVYLDCFNFRWN